MSIWDHKRLSSVPWSHLESREILKLTTHMKVLRSVTPFVALNWEHDFQALRGQQSAKLEAKQCFYALKILLSLNVTCGASLHILLIWLGGAPLKFSNTS